MTDSTQKLALADLARRLIALPPDSLLMLSALLLEHLGHARQPAAGPPDAAEIKRRARFLVSRAERGGYGQPVCCFCGKTAKGNVALENHLRRNHTADLAEMPAWRFAP